MLDLPMEMRLALLFVIGLLVGRQSIEASIVWPGFRGTRALVAAARRRAAAVAFWIACRCSVGGVCAASRRGTAPATGFARC